MQDEAFISVLEEKSSNPTVDASLSGPFAQAETDSNMDEERFQLEDKLAGYDTITNALRDNGSGISSDGYLHPMNASETSSESMLNASDETYFTHLNKSPSSHEHQTSTPAEAIPSDLKEKQSNSTVMVQRTTPCTEAETCSDMGEERFAVKDKLTGYDTITNALRDNGSEISSDGYIHPMNAFETSSEETLNESDETYFTHLNKTHPTESPH